MGESASACKLSLLGPFRLERRGGGRIDISSKRGQAMLAMLATSGAGERTRAWLQDKLWGSRGAEQAQASLRRELSNLRQIVNQPGSDILHADHQRVWLDLAQVQVDLRDLDHAGAGEFLEGFDLAREDGFEDWLRSERQRADQRRQQPALAPVAEPSPSSAKLDPGFADRPALAVLPFGNGTGDPTHDLLAEGLSEDLIDRLSRLRWLPVIARSSSHAATDDDPRNTAQALGARYVVEGNLRSGAVLQLLASLTDMQSGQILWSSRIALPEPGNPAGLEELLGALAATLDLKVDQREQARALAKPPADLAVSDLIWRGRWHLNRLSRLDAERARECFEQALAREQASPEALIQSTWARLWDLWRTRGAEAEIRAVRQMAQRAIIADYDDARGHMLAGIAESWLRQPLRSEALLRRAIDLNPSLVLAHAQLGSTLTLRDAPAEALVHLDFAIRLSPNDQQLFFIAGERALAHLMLDNWAAALTDAETAISRRGAYWYAHVLKINALTYAGEQALAQRALAELLANSPTFEPGWLDWIPFIDRSWNDFLKRGLNPGAGRAD